MDKVVLIKKEIEKLMLKSSVKEDPVHSKLVLKWVLKLKPDADVALQIAALGHDIDRCFKERKVKIENFESYDKFKEQHALMSAKILSELLEKFDFDKEVIDRVKYLVEYHETGRCSDTEILKEADSIAFSEYNLSFFRKTHTLEQTKDKIKFMYTRLSKKAKKIVSQIKLKDKEIDELLKNTISKY